MANNQVYSFTVDLSELSTTGNTNSILASEQTFTANVTMAGPTGPQGIQGPQGTTGATGATGATGPGVASGGTGGQVLFKNSLVNYDTAWGNLPTSLPPSGSASGDLAGSYPSPTLASTSNVTSVVAINAPRYVELAGIPDLIISGTITRDSNGAALSASVVWPDSTTGTYTADAVSSSFPGAVDAYHITYGPGPLRTYTQSTVTRDSTTGAVTNRPAITVS